MACVLPVLVEEKRWDDLVQYLNTKQGREDSIRAHDEEEYKVLHAILEVDHKAPLSVIEAVLQVFPNEPSMYNDRGCTALQYAITFMQPPPQRPNPISMSSIMAMLRSCPDSAILHSRQYMTETSTVHIAAFVDRSEDGELVKAILEINPDLARSRGPNYRADLPLNFACRGGGKGSIQALLDAYPEAAALRNSNKFGFPFHEACGSMRNVEPELLQRVLSCHPQALTTTSHRERLPLHLACFYKRISISFLIEADPSIASKPDSDGNLPLHLALIRTDGCSRVSKYPNIGVKSLQDLISAYPEALFHRNHFGQLPSQLLLETIDLTNDIAFFDQEDENEVKQRASQRRLWSCLLTEIYREVKKRFYCQNQELNEKECKRAKHHEIKKVIPPPTMWHAVLAVGSLFTLSEFDKLLIILVEMGVVEDLRNSEDLLNKVDEYGNTLVHVLFLSFTHRVINLITTKDDAFNNIKEIFSENESDSDDEYDDTFVCEGAPHFERLHQSIEEHLLSPMSKELNRDNELPLHILLKQPCQKEVNVYCCCRNKIRKKGCFKYDDMRRLIDYYPLSVSQKDGKSKFVPFMLAAVHCNYATFDTNQCTQCLSCIYELLRNGGVQSCRVGHSKEVNNQKDSPLEHQSKKLRTT